MAKTILIIRQGLILLALLAVSACSPRTVPAPAPLSEPRLLRLPQATRLPGFGATTTPASLQAGSTPQPAGALLKLSQEVYGKRLIEQISIPSLGIETAVVPVGWRYASAGNADPDNIEWDSPGDFVGWTITSRLPGQAGNIILYGHNNTYTAIFKDLSKLKPGARVFLKTGLHLWEYQVDSINIIPVVFSDAQDRSAYQNLLKDDGLPRLTLVSCWPPVSNTHRVVVSAFPVVSP